MRSNDHRAHRSTSSSEGSIIASALGVNTPGTDFLLPPTVGSSASSRETTSSRIVSMERRKITYFKTFLPSDLTFRISSTTLLSTTSSTVMKSGCPIAWLWNKTLKQRSEKGCKNYKAILTVLFECDALSICFQHHLELVIFAYICFHRVWDLRPIVIVMMPIHVAT